MPQCPDWNRLETLNNEKAMIGMYLSPHPLDTYKIVIQRFCNTQLTQFANLNDLKDKDFTVAGMVTEVQNLYTKTGKPFGRFKLEDYSGQHEFVLFDKDYENFRKYLFKDYFLLIKGSVRPRPYRDTEYEAKITSMQMLDDVLGGISELTLNLPIQEITPDATAELTERLTAAKGKINLRIKVIDPHEGVSLVFFSRKYKVALTQELVDYLENSQINYRIA